MHMMLLCLLLCLSSSCVECSQPWSKESISTTCGGGENLLCDLDNVLNASETASSLTSLLEKDLGKKGDCAKKIYVVIIRHLANPYAQEIDRRMNETSEYLREQWRGKCCTIAVILLSTGDARVWTRFCDQLGLCWRAVKETYKENRHHLFDEKQYGVGLEKIIEAYQEEIKHPDSCAEGLTVLHICLIILMCAILLVPIMSWCLCALCCDRRRAPGSSGSTGSQSIGGGGVGPSGFGAVGGGGACGGGGGGGCGGGGGGGR